MINLEEKECIKKRWEEFSLWAEKGQAIKDTLTSLVDEDTRAFNLIMDAFGMPKNTEEEKHARHQSIQAATRHAIAVPFMVMKAGLDAMEVIEAMVIHGNPASVTDAGVGALCARTAVVGAYLNVKVNSNDVEDKIFVNQKLKLALEMVEAASAKEAHLLKLVEEKLGK